MNKHELISEIKQSYMLKRIKAEEECELFIESLKQNQEFNDLYFNYTKKQLDYLKSRFEQENLNLKQEIASLQAQIDKFLEKNKISKEKLNPKYECPLCKDTGKIDDKQCKCIIKEFNLRLTNLVSSQNVFKSFDDCNKKIMDTSDMKLFEFVKGWCAKYPNITKININILGGAGTGKTFLLECIASSMIKLGKSVCYKTAFDVNEICKQYHLGKSNEFYDLLNSEILLIDDLGTEPIFKNVTKEYLYNIINQRQINKKPTFITTNLSLDNILDKYDERIFSRLANKNLSINMQLSSSDKRII